MQDNIAGDEQRAAIRAGLRKMRNDLTVKEANHLIRFTNRDFGNMTEAQFLFITAKLQELKQDKIQNIITQLLGGKVPYEATIDVNASGCKGFFRKEELYPREPSYNFDFTWDDAL